MRKSGSAPSSHKPQGEWNRVAELMMSHFEESGHPVFRCSSLLYRGTLKIKVGGKLSIHYNAEPQTEALLLRTIIAVNQLSVYEEVAK